MTSANNAPRSRHIARTRKISEPPEPWVGATPRRIGRAGRAPTTLYPGWPVRTSPRQSVNPPWQTVRLRGRRSPGGARDFSRGARGRPGTWLPGNPYTRACMRGKASSLDKLPSPALASRCCAFAYALRTYVLHSKSGTACQHYIHNTCWSAASPTPPGIHRVLQNMAGRRGCPPGDVHNVIEKCRPRAYGYQ